MFAIVAVVLEIYMNGFNDLL